MIQCSNGTMLPFREVQDQIAIAIHSNHTTAEDEPACWMCRADAKVVTTKLIVAGVITNLLSAVS